MTPVILMLMLVARLQYSGWWLWKNIKYLDRKVRENRRNKNICQKILKIIAIVGMNHNTFHNGVFLQTLCQCLAGLRLRLAFRLSLKLSIFSTLYRQLSMNWVPKIVNLSSVQLKINATKVIVYSKLYNCNTIDTFFLLNATFRFLN